MTYDETLFKSFTTVYMYLIYFYFFFFKPEYRNSILIDILDKSHFVAYSRYESNGRVVVQCKSYLSSIQNYKLVQKRFLHKGHVELLEVLNHLYKQAA